MSVADIKYIWWTCHIYAPPEGRNTKLGLYIECFCCQVWADIINKKIPLKTQSQLHREKCHGHPEKQSRYYDKASRWGRSHCHNGQDKLYPGIWVTTLKHHFGQVAVLRPHIWMPLNTQQNYEKNTSSNTGTNLFGYTWVSWPGTFYLLPRYTNPATTVSSISNITGYLDSTLTPDVINTSDTIDFLKKLHSISQKSLLENSIVSTLYTNNPYKDGLQAIRSIIHDNLTADHATELCMFVLTHNYFSLGENLYLWINGTAVGTPWSYSMSTFPWLI